MLQICCNLSFIDSCELENFQIFGSNLRWPNPLQQLLQCAATVNKP